MQMCTGPALQGSLQFADSYRLDGLPAQEKSAREYIADSPQELPELGTTCSACVPHARLELSLHGSQLREAFQWRQGLRTLQVQLATHNTQ